MSPAPAVAPAQVDIDAVAAEILATFGTGRQIAPFTSRPAGLSVDDAYRVSAALDAMRAARGESRLGRKIGFTNRTIWHEYGVYAPIWGFVYDSTVHDLGATEVLSLAGFAEPRIEPEIVFGLSAAPSADMNEAALLACLEWVAHGFEIVQSIYPRWKFAAADTVAANGVHGALLIGPRHPIAPRAGAWRPCCRPSTSISAATAAPLIAAMPPMSSAARSRRCVIWSGCWRTIASTRRSPPARS